MNLFKSKKNILILIFTTIYSLISLINHYNFRTYALDLGLYNKALFDYSHFRWNNSSLFKVVEENLLADHFDIYLILFSPLQYLFGSYTLLIIQIFFIILGGIGIHKYFLYNFPKKKHIATYALTYYFLFFGVYGAVSFDYHSSVIASTLIPWFFLFWEQKKKYYLIIFISILIAKETMALWMLFILLGLILKHRKETKSLIVLGILSILSLFYFLTVTKGIMPALSASHNSPFTQFSSIGRTIPDIIKNVFSSKKRFFDVLFTNHTNDVNGDYVKLEFYIFLLLSGAFLLIKKPYYFIMILPIIAQKVLHNRYLMWGVDSHYSMEFAPIFAIGIFSIIGKLKNNRVEKLSSLIILFGVLIVTLRLMDNTVIFTSKSKIRIYQKNHYVKEYEINSVYKGLSLIPKDAAVSAQSPFVPHLALRKDIFQFPIINNATYIVYSLNEGFYPLSKKEFILKIQQLKSDNWVEYFRENNFIILKKKLTTTNLPNLHRHNNSFRLAVHRVF